MANSWEAEGSGLRCSGAAARCHVVLQQRHMGQINPPAFSATHQGSTSLPVRLSGRFIPPGPGDEDVIYRQHTNTNKLLSTRLVRVPGFLLRLCECKQMCFFFCIVQRKMRDYAEYVLQGKKLSCFGWFNTSRWQKGRERRTDRQTVRGVTERMTERVRE